MVLASANRWRLVARALKAIGTIGFILSFACWLLLTSYYSAKRPHAPQTERGWTIVIEWTHPPSYGTAREASRVQRLFLLFIPFFGLMALGEAIKTYKLNDYSGFTAIKRPR